MPPCAFFSLYFSFSHWLSDWRWNLSEPLRGQLWTPWRRPDCGKGERRVRRRQPGVTEPPGELQFEDHIPTAGPSTMPNLRPVDGHELCSHPHWRAQPEPSGWPWTLLSSPLEGPTWAQWTAMISVVIPTGGPNLSPVDSHELCSHSHYSIVPFFRVRWCM